MIRGDINIEAIVSTVIGELKARLFIEVEASGRHVHVSKQDLESLFGTGYRLTPAKELSQPGQYACQERVTLQGPKGTLRNVVILGPERKETQVEVSLTDCNVLGVKAPVRLSGDIEGSPGITIINEKNGKSITITNGLIVAKRHIHITPEDACRFGVENGETVKVKVFGERPLIFDDMDVRVSKDFQTYIHIDYDEANACGYTKGTKGMILK